MPQVPLGGNPLRLLMRVPVPWVFVLGYLAGVALEVALPRARVALPASTPVVGALLFCLGAAFAGWAWWLFRRAGTTRVPGEASTSLVTWGPYRFSRNPMYVGLAIAYLGEVGMLRQVWPILLLVAVLAYVNWIVIPVEEARLREVFGGAYERYSGAVRRWA